MFDECHHLPGPSYLLTAVGSIAPYRLGLTATPERADQQESLLPELIGPILFRREIKELSGSYLAEYRTERRYVFLSTEEQARYDLMRGEYRRFVDERASRSAVLKAGSDFCECIVRRLVGLPSLLEQNGVSRRRLRSWSYWKSWPKNTRRSRSDFHRRQRQPAYLIASDS